MSLSSRVYLRRSPGILGVPMILAFANLMRHRLP
jgi:hypothetical protein